MLYHAMLFVSVELIGVEKARRTARVYVCGSCVV